MKYDLKGSTHDRLAGDEEKAKGRDATLRDMDFRDAEKKTRILTDPSVHDSLMDILEKDCLMLQSNAIMDAGSRISALDVDRSR